MWYMHSVILVSPSAWTKLHGNTAGFLLLGPWQKSKDAVFRARALGNQSQPCYKRIPITTELSLKDCSLSPDTTCREERNPNS
ncbi:hypothetical protein AV530_004603 [Patagioenas fasciata monilis]|uniref:Uncharacterized protein n=1 Tax=Patagioenas fasciata monilis TaxID=372326 RepID=A0A1V4KHL1_PATFA|nr:hypothetical protein AV530_004603 [Patagioenas fasciata monilis]